MFATCGSLPEANQVFREVPEKNVYMWSAAILANANLGQAEHAIQLYHLMQQSCVEPNDYIFVALLKACANMQALTKGNLIHAHIIESGIDFPMIVGNTLIDMYCKCGGIEDANRLFDKFLKRNVVTWTAMIAGLTRHGHGLKALQLYEQMQEVGLQPDIVTYVSIWKACSIIAALDQGKLTHSHIIESGFESDVYAGSTLIEMYAKCGSLLDAIRVFDKLLKRDSVTWTAMIAAYAMHSNYESALCCFKDMQQEGLKPDGVTFVSLLSVCSHVGLVDDGFHHFESITKDYGIKLTLNHYDCMVDLLGRAGHLKDAQDLLQTTPSGSNIVGWTSLLNSCRIFGNVELGKRCFDCILTMEPKEASGYILMSKIYADAHMWEDIDVVNAYRKSASAWKEPGKAFIEIANQGHEFVVGDNQDKKGSDLHAKLQHLSLWIKENGHAPLLDLVLQTRSDEDDEDDLLVRLTVV